MLMSGCQIHLYGSGGDTDLAQQLQCHMERAYCPVPDFFTDGIGAQLSVTNIDETPSASAARRLPPDKSTIGRPLRPLVFASPTGNSRWRIYPMWNTCRIRTGSPHWHWPMASVY
jgi:hypothetical protein